MQRSSWIERREADIPDQRSQSRAPSTRIHGPMAPSPAMVAAINISPLTLEGEQIAAITQFLDTSILSRFGFPRTLRDGG